MKKMHSRFKMADLLLVWLQQACLEMLHLPTKFRTYTSNLKVGPMTF